MKMNMEKPLSSSMRRFIFVVTQKKAEEKISDFRNFWGIKSEGFKNKNEYNQWLKKIIARPPIKLVRVVLWGEITGYAITQDDIFQGKTNKKSNITDGKASCEELFNDNFQKAVDELGAEIRMDNTWRRLFMDYLLRGNKALINKGGATLDIFKITEYYEEGKTVREKLIVTIEPNTTKEQVLSAWNRFIGSEKEKMVGFINPPSHVKIKKPDL